MTNIDTGAVTVNSTSVFKTVGQISVMGGPDQYLLIDGVVGAGDALGDFKIQRRTGPAASFQDWISDFSAGSVEYPYGSSGTLDVTTANGSFQLKVKIDTRCDLLFAAKVATTTTTLRLFFSCGAGAEIFNQS